MSNETKKFSRKPLRIKEVIRRGYPWLAERIEKNRENKSKKVFVMKKKSIIFVAFLSGTNFLTFVCVVFFIATNTALNAANLGYHSIGYCTAKSVIVPDRTEKGSLSSFYTFIFHSMSGTMKNASTPNNSKRTSTSAHETSFAIIQLQVSNPYSIARFDDFLTEASRRFEVEKNAKNRLYSFILSHGLLKDYSEFCRMGIYSDNPHTDCLAHLELLITDEN